MTAPRYILPGSTYLVTRRTVERRFYLRPDPDVRSILSYCLAEAAERFGVRLIAWTFLSNHYHAVVEDPTGCLPDFLCHFHKMTARALNVHWDRREALWSCEPASVVRLVGLEDVRNKVAYTLANPVRANLVARAKSWVGESSLDLLDGRASARIRPCVFFRPRGDMPPTVTARAAIPSAWQGDRSSWVGAVLRDVREIERRMEQQRARTGGRVLGISAVLGVRPDEAPRSEEPRRRLRPEVACLDVVRRADELLRLRAFRAAYAEARAALSRGLAAVFPEGTFKLARLVGWARAAAPALARAAPCAPS